MTWHILRKDLRRLAIPIALTLALLIALSLLDAWRHDALSGLAETVLNLLVPLGWAILVAAAVQLEPLTSDKAFWLTRPYRRSSLVLAKIAFAVLTVHVPLLVAHAAILMSHGFAPLHSALLWKQLTVAVTITIPSLAIASMTSTIAGFGWCAIAAGAVALLLDAALIGYRFPWIQADWMPVAIALALVSTAAVAIVALQYSRRTVWTGRAIGLVVALAAVLLYSYLPRDFTEALQCSLEPDAPQQIAVRYQPGGEVPQRLLAGTQPGRVPVGVPVEVSGLEGARHVWVEQLWLRLSSANGRTWETRRDLRPDRRAYLAVNPEEGVSAQLIVPDRTFFNAIVNSPARLEGRASVRPVRALPPKVLPSTFPLRDVPGVGRCSASVYPAMFGQEMLTIVCESPEPIQRLLRVRLIDPEQNRDWRHGLGDATSAHFPSLVWLSPLNRRQTYLQIAETESKHPGNRWLVPKAMLDRAKVSIEPWVGEGCVNVEYAFDVPAWGKL